ncbi:uncharacterized protein [Argopecten irradians]|uniref:uncharacterized protein n=1 Tax=Argopecten irradians TaxID=31199 RepID=UPI00371E4A0E
MPGRRTRQSRRRQPDPFTDISDEENVAVANITSDEDQGTAGIALSHKPEEINTEDTGNEEGLALNQTLKWLAETMMAMQSTFETSLTAIKMATSPFTDKETWKTWFSRFETVADRCRWGHEERLDQLLPRLQGKAGEFVLDQLTKRERNNYKILVRELNNRYRVIESSKTYAAQFSRRNQKPSESVEEYAAELKRLYDKAHKRRDTYTRTEDLLRKFFDGVYNEKASFEVEFHKDPKNIDEAVFHVVNYIETKRMPNRRIEDDDQNARKMRKVEAEQCSDASENEWQDEDFIKNHNSVRAVNTVNKEKNKQRTEVSNESQSAEGVDDEMKDILVKACEQITSRMNKSPTNLDDRRCYTCNEVGHISRNCPLRNQSHNCNMDGQRLEGRGNSMNDSNGTEGEMTLVIPGTFLMDNMHMVEPLAHITSLERKLLLLVGFLQDRTILLVKRLLMEIYEALELLK